MSDMAWARAVCVCVSGLFACVFIVCWHLECQLNDILLQQRTATGPAGRPPYYKRTHGNSGQAVCLSMCAPRDGAPRKARGRAKHRLNPRLTASS